MTNTRLFAGDTHRMAGDFITWVGVCPWRSTTAYGTEGGKIVVTRDKSGGKKALKETISSQVLSEPVNAMAFLDAYGAVTSRSGVFLFKRKGELIDAGRLSQK